MPDDLDSMTREELIEAARRARESEANKDTGYRLIIEDLRDQLAAKDAQIAALKEKEVRDAEAYLQLNDEHNARLVERDKAEAERDELKRVIRDMDYSYSTNDWATIRMGTFRTLKALAHAGGER